MEVVDLMVVAMEKADLVVIVVVNVRGMVVEN